MGSSTVIICFFFVLFICFSNDARVVDFHDQTDHVTRINQCFLFVKFNICGGKPKLSKSGISVFIGLKTSQKPFL